MVLESDSRFPADFTWGVAAAAYQIEGAAGEDGRGESIWDRFCRIPGKVHNGDTGDIACDHYHRYQDDVALMRDLGISAYRFSVAWPRVIPNGVGDVNSKGLDFYDRLVNDLLNAGIEPYITLYHWDLPQVLEDRGGWTNRDTADAFAAYVEAVVRRLGDRVHHWITQNEPQVASFQGYGGGEHAPGRDEGLTSALSAAHHLLLSHGKAAQVIRSISPDAQIGITLNIDPIYPLSQDSADLDAARQIDGSRNRWFLDPIFRGTYPEDMVATWERYMPHIEERDLETISVPVDFLGVNNYSRTLVRGEHGKPKYIHPRESSYTDMDWEVYPEGIHDLLVRITRDYAPPRIYITENGAAFPDVREHDGSVRDPERTAFLQQYVAAAARAIREGVQLAGYFVWSLLDNFEWGWGYWKRFGITYVDYPTLERVPKQSFEWYRDFIASQRSTAGSSAAR